MKCLYAKRAQTHITHFHIDIICKCGNHICILQCYSYLTMKSIESQSTNRKLEMSNMYLWTLKQVLHIINSFIKNLKFL